MKLRMYIACQHIEVAGDYAEDFIANLNKILENYGAKGEDGKPVKKYTLEMSVSIESRYR